MIELKAGLPALGLVLGHGPFHIVNWLNFCHFWGGGEPYLSNAAHLALCRTFLQAH